jgi:alpha-1,3-rhamnosyltransferase
MLVSVIVITYNSEKFVLDTLESIKEQDYLEIELIISDDCSNDRTLEICEKWLEKNKDRFKRSKIIKGDFNQGVVKNLEKGCKESKGEWIKIIAGDDILLKNCISLNSRYVQDNNQINFLFSKVETFGKKEIILPSKDKIKYYTFSPDKQYFQLLLGNFILAPTSFIKRKRLEELGCFDSKTRIIEDLPMWLKATKAGEKLYFLDKITVKYRIHEESISLKPNPNYIKDMKIIKDTYISRKNYILKYHFNLLIKLSTLKGKKNRKFLKLLSPLYIINKIFVEKR